METTNETITPPDTCDVEMEAAADINAPPDTCDAEMEAAADINAPPDTCKSDIAGTPEFCADITPLSAPSYVFSAYSATLSDNAL
jgi:hypothetical protein